MPDTLPPPQTPPPWGPAAGGAAASPPPPAAPAGEPAAPRRRGRGTVLAAAAVVILLATIASTAAITYALTTRSAEVPSETEAPEPIDTDKPAEPTAAETKAAKDALCSAFDLTTKGFKGSGGMVQDGEINIPVILRTIGGVIAVQNAIVPALGNEISSTAREYVDANLELANAAMANTALGEIAELTNGANNATLELAAACGLK